jgi:sec-independent protein translocase protein TatA
VFRDGDEMICLPSQKTVNRLKKLKKKAKFSTKELTMGEFSLTHILIVLIIVLLFFGPSKLPQLGQSIGKAIRGFKDGLNELDAEVKPLPKENTTREALSTEQKTEAQRQTEKETQHKS